MLDLATGQERERLGGDTDSYDVRGALAARGDTLARTTENCRLSVYADGEESWAANVCQPSSDEWVLTRNYTPPMFVGGAVVTHAPIYQDYETSDMSLTVRRLDGGAEVWSAPTEVWFESLEMTNTNLGYDQNYHASLPWLMNGILYTPQVTLPHVVGFDMGTGEARVSMSFADCRNRQFASIVGTPSRGYFARHDGRLYGFAPASGRISWSISLQWNSTVGTAGAASGMLSHPSAYPLEDTYCYADPYDGSALFSTPAIGSDGVLYVGSGEGFLYAIGDTTW